MRLWHPALPLLALLLGGPALICAQDQPLAAGAEGVPVPKKKKHVQPVYPKDALARGIRGIVILDLVIDTEGRVIETTIIRSIPGLDEAARAAARQWRYEPVEVNGKAVSVRLTVPITFALKLPDMSRQAGIPELRQGVAPSWPSDGDGRGEAVADVTLESDGRVALARIVQGSEPWSSSLLQALRTWRFRAVPDDATVSFRVEAEFLPGGPEKGSVELRLSGLRETPLLPAPAAETAALAGAEPVPGHPAEAPERPQDEGPTHAAPGATRSEDQEPRPEAPLEPEQEPPATVADTAPPPSGKAEGEEPTAPPEKPVEDADDGAQPVQMGVAARAPDAGTSLGKADLPAPPPIEVLSPPPPPLPPENGISAIRGVELEPGVPDLTRGRRPVAPPFARMGRESGTVTVEFSVSAGGITTVQQADGPQVFLPAATQAVESWVFRRTRADRAYLTAVFTYEDDLASAVVRPQPAP